MCPPGDDYIHIPAEFFQSEVDDNQIIYFRRFWHLCGTLHLEQGHMALPTYCFLTLYIVIVVVVAVLRVVSCVQSTIVVNDDIFFSMTTMTMGWFILFLSVGQLTGSKMCFFPTLRSLPVLRLEANNASTRCVYIPRFFQILTTDWTPWCWLWRLIYNIYMYIDIFIFILWCVVSHHAEKVYIWDASSVGRMLPMGPVEELQCSSCNMAV